MATLGNLPEELMIEILSRLPPESLLRLKSVQKSWYALINDSKFVTKHFSNSLHHDHVLLKRVITNGAGGKESIFSILQFPYSDVRSEFVFYDDFVYFEICGHSHGLLCLFERKKIFLCNPATREIRKLPPSILHLTEPPEEPDGYESFTNAVGFGYDPRSKDFKVVRVVGFVEEPSVFYPPRVEIYDLRKDKWREIESPVCGHVLLAPMFAMYHEGTYYWWAHDDGDHEIIQTFDMTHEVFGRISLPEGYRENDSSLGVLNGSIVLFYYPLPLPETPEKTFDLWEMEKDETGIVSWSKVLTIGPISGIETLLFVRSDELLMEASGGRVVMCNIRTQQLKELHIKGHPRKFRATFFVKSLVSVKGRSQTSYEFEF